MRKPFAFSTAALFLCLQAQAMPWVVNESGSIYRIHDGKWEQMPGAAKAIAARGDNIWVIGTRKTTAGYALYHWNGKGWDESQGKGGVRLAIGPKGNPLVLCADGSIYEQTPQGPVDLPGSATDLASSASGLIVCAGTKKVDGGHAIYKWDSGAWKLLDGGADRLAVNPLGTVFVVNDSGNMCYGDGQHWIAIKGQAKELAIGSRGDMWSIGTDHGIYVMSNGAWKKIDGEGVAIAAE